MLLHRFSRGLSRALALGAAAFIVAVLVIQLASIAGRLADVTVQAADAYAGYCLAAASFLAMGAALYQGDHIRVTLLLQRLGERARHRVELACLAAGTLLTGYFVWFAVALVWGSWSFHELSPNIDATPLWLPQLSMAVGLFGLWLAFVDQLLRTWMTGKVQPTEAAASIAPE